MISTLGYGADGQLRGVYHRALRRAGRFGLPEDDATTAVLAVIAACSVTILDIGANVGLYAWFLDRHRSPHSTLYAFEPNPEAARLLRRTIGVRPKSVVLEIAASDRDDSGELVVPDGPFGAPISALAWVRSQGGWAERRVLRIAMRRIDSLVQDGTISVVSPAFIKIDVEGGEALVLRGAVGVLRRHRPVIYFECEAHSTARQGETPEGVWSAFGEAGYWIFANLEGWFVQVDRIQAGVVNYIAIPALNEFVNDQPLSVAAMIAVIGRWADFEARP